MDLLLLSVHRQSLFNHNTDNKVYWKLAFLFLLPGQKLLLNVANTTLIFRKTRLTIFMNRNANVIEMYEYCN